MVRIGAVLIALDNQSSEQPTDVLLPWPGHSVGRRLVLLSGLPQHEYLNTYYRACAGKLGKAEVIETLRRALPYAKELRVVVIGGELAKRFGVKWYQWPEEIANPGSPFELRVRLSAIPSPVGRRGGCLVPAKRQRVSEVLKHARYKASPVADLVERSQRWAWTWRNPSERKHERLNGSEQL